MFEGLTGRLGDILDRLKKSASLAEPDVDKALREVRVALLEADVALPVVKDFIAKVRARAVGQEVLRSVTPGQMVVKIVHDALVEMLAGPDGSTVGSDSLNLQAAPPLAIMMVGLQGSGKTTTTAKIAKRLQTRDKKKVLMASLDTRRPAAQEQLKILGEQAGVPTLPISAGQNPVDIARRAMEAARLSGVDVVLLDTAGRLSIDESLMAELQQIETAANPTETLIVVDSLTGQDAVNVAENFRKRINLTGVVLTRVDGDGRGGAALSMRAVTGCPIKLMGVGEKIDDLEGFHAERVAGRILGMGDVVGLVEKAAESIDQEKAQKMAKKMVKGAFDLEDLREQLRQMRQLGGMSSMLGLLPGIGKLKKQLDSADLDDKVLIHQEAIIGSMTPHERRNPKLLNASRKRRIARGSGLTVQDVNKLLKMHRQMSDVMKRMGRMGKKGMMGGLGGALGLGGGQLAPGNQLPGLGGSGAAPQFPSDLFKK